MASTRFPLQLLNKAAAKSLTWLHYQYRAIVPDKALLQELDTHFEVGIEVTNICNANCTFCAYQYQERPPRRMEESTFRKALAGFVELGGGTLGMGSLVGDPLLDPQFVERVRYARSFPVIKGVSTTTNCIHLDKVGVDDFVTSGVTEVTVSTSGFDPEMYKRVYRSSHFERMKQNLLDLLHANHRRGRPARISVGLRLDRPPEEVLNHPEFKPVLELADDVSWNWYYDDWSGRIQQKDLTGNMKVRPDWYKHLRRRLPCKQLWTGTMILVNGAVTACGCRDLNGDSELVIGNINDTPLPELMVSAAFNKLKKEWLGGRHVPDICQDCKHYTPYVAIPSRT